NTIHTKREWKHCRGVFTQYSGLDCCEQKKGEEPRANAESRGCELEKAEEPQANAQSQGCERKKRE
ncbi:hypothetical protein AB990_03230, partial [Alkalihalobacillus pseudalcaliphilus]